ncbi:hypothetical protein [Ferrimonas pelagia]|uniref:PBP domain-containing protein n=1 Tax=Ferrimonas pelagia TaxID=1177826 RepID=A0ABP9EE52_9GAMM
MIKAIKQWVTAVGLLVLSAVSVAESEERTAQIIVQDAVSVEQLKRTDLRAIFTMKKQFWPDGTAITVFVLPPRDPVHVQFCRDALKLLPFQLNREWDRLVFSGTGERPQVVSSAAQMLELVQTTPGAIGYLPASVNAKGYDIAIIK